MDDAQAEPTFHNLSSRLGVMSWFCWRQGDFCCGDQLGLAFILCWAIWKKSSIPSFV